MLAEFGCSRVPSPNGAHFPARPQAWPSASGKDSVELSLFVHYVHEQAPAGDSSIFWQILIKFMDA
jgi:hypothetical protein